MTMDVYCMLYPHSNKREIKQWGDEVTLDEISRSGGPERPESIAISCADTGPWTEVQDLSLTLGQCKTCLGVKGVKFIKITANKPPPDNSEKEKQSLYLTY